MSDPQYPGWEEGGRDFELSRLLKLYELGKEKQVLFKLCDGSGVKTSGTEIRNALLPVRNSSFRMYILPTGMRFLLLLQLTAGLCSDKSQNDCTAKISLHNDWWIVVRSLK
ncbi:hypothetical protein GUJ93_ZPchr0006g43747 [Zizania palustris]|uniref:Uncharacterized protein n=1 Tax=Zizania palustris TaxID=103762 RepID=A0A8J5T2T9_ZIZPA|nr:hypothetical protein GUJ93_ZPchr0006g43747 [Zizania palustris]